MWENGCWRSVTLTVPLWGKKRGVCSPLRPAEGCPALVADSEREDLSPGDHPFSHQPPRQARLSWRRTAAAEGGCTHSPWPSYKIER